MHTLNTVQKYPRHAQKADIETEINRYKHQLLVFYDRILGVLSSHQAPGIHNANQPDIMIQGSLSIGKSDALLKQVITITSLKIITHSVFQLDKIVPKSLTQNVYGSIK